jgi:hypothetical protein
VPGADARVRELAEVTPDRLKGRRRSGDGSKRRQYSEYEKAAQGSQM